MNKQPMSWRQVAPLFVGGVIAIAATITGSIVFATNQKSTGVISCDHTGATHRVVIQHDRMTPTYLTAKQCDVLQITNRDAITREIGFGEHDHHVAYNGVSEKVLQQGQSLALQLNRTGTYHFHDHFHDELEGVFVVKR